MDSVLTVIVGVGGLVVGWLVGGYQRVTEKLIEERRHAFAGLLEAAEGLRAGQQDTRSDLVKAAARAELVCSPQMAKSRLIRVLVQEVDGSSFDDAIDIPQCGTG